MDLVGHAAPVPWVPTSVHAAAEHLESIRPSLDLYPYALEIAAREREAPATPVSDLSATA